MKKIILSLIGFTTLLIACQKNAPVESSNLNVAAKSGPAPGVIPSDVKLNQFTFHTEKHTWKEVDDYYRKEVKNNNQSDTYYNNLRKLTISVLVNQYKLVENADYRTIDYYAGELLSIDLPDADVFLKVFKSVQGRWSNDQLSTLTLKKYNDSMSFIQENFKDPQKVLNEPSIKNYGEIKKFAESLINR